MYSFSSLSQGINSAEGFRAGAFVSSQDIPKPPHPKTGLYRENAIRHVAPRPSGPTPFISLSTSLIRCLHRAVRVGTGKIAVVNLRELDYLGIVQATASLELQVDHRYHPWNEFLVWVRRPLP